ncbi:hypothetical protein C8R45DRAFT_1223654 [Mycena sanguinolenta]|nr:hypothetical protein C8R45DRAFT_1223654 [Mycena sanguinolenta]
MHCLRRALFGSPFFRSPFCFILVYTSVHPFFAIPTILALGLPSIPKAQGARAVPARKRWRRPVGEIGIDSFDTSGIKCKPTSASLTHCGGRRCTICACSRSIALIEEAAVGGREGDEIGARRLLSDPAGWCKPSPRGCSLAANVLPPQPLSVFPSTVVDPWTRTRMDRPAIAIFLGPPSLAFPTSLACPFVLRRGQRAPVRVGGGWC